MEFENVGTHCEFPSCNQRDFLPFKCDVCKINLCLAHRSYSAHNCSGKNAKDMTSVDCPVCGKGIRLSKVDNADLVWEAHFSNECSQQPGSARNENKKCHFSQCNVKLGPSNTFQCPKCHKKVCMTHRIPDDHNCSGLSTNRPRALATKSSSSSTATKPSSLPTKSATKSTNKPQAPQADNSLRGTAARRIRSADSNNAPSPDNYSSPSRIDTQSTFSCPICGVNFNDEMTLMTHINYEHDMDSRDAGRFQAPSPASASNIPQPSTPTGREVCPHCSLRFVDPVDLVAHVEGAHSRPRPSGSKCAIS